MSIGQHIIVSAVWERIKVPCATVGPRPVRRVYGRCRDLGAPVLTTVHPARSANAEAFQ